MFNRELARKIQHTIEKYDMLCAEDIVICALSGGADSVVMAFALQSLGINIKAAHFIHGIRLNEGASELALVQRFCSKHGIELFWEQGNTPKFAAENKLGLEEAARILRYKFLQECAKKCETSVNQLATSCITSQQDAQKCMPFGVKIATAHHLQDNAETVIYNLARGTGARGLCGIPPTRQNIIRPMICISRAEIEKVAKENFLEFATDVTNFQPTYARNKIRLNVMPTLTQINSSAAKKIMENCEILREDNAFLEAMAQEFIENSVKITQSKAVFELGILKKQPKPIASRAIKMTFEQICNENGSLSFKNIEDINAIVAGQNPSAKCDLSHGVQACRQYDSLVLKLSTNAVQIDADKAKKTGQNAGIKEPSKAENGFCHSRGKREPTIKLLAHGEHLFTQNFRITLGGQEENGDNVCWLPKSDAQPPFFVRSRQTGDEIKVGMHHKKIKKLMIEKKIPMDLRGDIPIVFDGNGAVVICHEEFLNTKSAAPHDDCAKFFKIVIHKIMS